MIGDTDLKVSKAWGMLPATLEGTCDGRTAADNQTVRNVFVVGPDKKIKLIIVYPMTTGRNFDEVLRVIDSLQLTAKHKVATPVNWKQGDEVIIAGSVLDEEAKKTYPEGGSHRSRTSGSSRNQASDETARTMAVACPVDLDTLKLRAEIQAVYRRVAAQPSGDSLDRLNRRRSAGGRAGQLLGQIGFDGVVVSQHFDCFRGTSKEGVARTYGVVGVNVFTHKPGV